METWDGDDMDQLVRPQRLEIWDNKHVQVTHDESTFYSNDGRDEFWMEEGDSWLKKKKDKAAQL
ncbi:MAG: hypothetical protein BJ554DRAFT_3735 [Olpidium bornovanus]|uniref:Uncharacterized protein n=1 Tax=Olpidium bornovanus TaxID=278681 RepID=A0A8H8DFB6_9FUNG|nr:MAG: hypothetical protein BJ554DRAFT_3735 [Olpidium bornovanus]